MGGSISRRELLVGLGALGVGALVAACTGRDGGDEQAGDSATTSTTSVTREPIGDAQGTLTPELFDQASSCTRTPEQTAGPFHLDVDAVRRDIREDREGVPLRLGLRIRGAQGCEPIEGAVVEVWHCDALGAYSGFQAASAGAPGAQGGGPSDDATFLRGAQVTDGDGIVEFLTVYPGWYPGRTVHVHVKVHLDGDTMLTSQLYFDDDVNTAVYEHEPYAHQPGRRMLNVEDGIFDDRLVLTVTPDGDGYLGLENLDVAASSTATGS